MWVTIYSEKWNLYSSNYNVKSIEKDINNKMYCVLTNGEELKIPENYKIDRVVSDKELAKLENDPEDIDKFFDLNNGYPKNMLNLKIDVK